MCQELFCHLVVQTLTAVACKEFGGLSENFQRNLNSIGIHGKLSTTLLTSYETNTDLLCGNHFSKCENMYTMIVSLLLLCVELSVSN